jgi:hypothetical protein
MSLPNAFFIGSRIFFQTRRHLFRDGREGGGAQRPFCEPKRRVRGAQGRGAQGRGARPKRNYGRLSLCCFLIDCEMSMQT